MTIYKGDNLQAFDGSPIEIEFDTGDKIVSKAQFVINNGAIVKEFNDPISPLTVTLDEADTKKLKATNYGKLILFDSLNRKKTCEGTLIFTAEDSIYNEG